MMGAETKPGRNLRRRCEAALEQLLAAVAEPLSKVAAGDLVEALATLQRLEKNTTELRAAVEARMGERTAELRQRLNRCGGQ